jgi:exosortase/archaeosortase family protein
MTVAAPPARALAARLAMLVAWTLASVALLGSPSVQAALLQPFAEWQARAVSWLIGAATLPVAMVPSCSGLDVMALCAGAIACYPASIERRFAGAAGGVTLLVALNLARIATLARTAASPGFAALHEFVWPAALTAAAVGYAGVWMWRVDRPALVRAERSTRTLVIIVALLTLYLIGVTVAGETGRLDAYAAAVASTAARLLRAIGVDASFGGRVLQVRDVRYLISYECVTTPLLPIYVAAVIAAPWRRRTRTVAALAAIPIFAALSVIRLATLAAPPLLFGSRLFFTHGFNQLLLAGLGISLAATMAPAASGWRAASRRAIMAIGVALVVATTAGAVYTRLLAGAFPVALQDPFDLQGALLTLPAFQLAFYTALAFALREHASPPAWLGGATVITLSHLALLMAAPAVRAAGSADAIALVWRGWALALPAVVAIVITRASRARLRPSTLA